MKLNAFQQGRPKVWLPPKLLLVMKLTTLILIVALVQTSAKSFSQQITLHEKNASLEKVLNSIKQQTGYVFFYEDKYTDQKITIHVEGASIEETLNLALSNLPLTYKITDKTILLQQKESSIFDKIKAAIAAIDVHGKITDDQGNPLPGATITVKGTGIRTITDASGYFALTKVAPDATIIISYIGYQTKEVKAGKDLGNIVLQGSQSQLDQIQVIAYGTTTQRLNTGNVTSIKAADIESQPVTNPLAALQGRVPGMVITQTSGVPGSSFKVQIRGQSALDLSLSKNDPLFVIDGVPFEQGNTATNQITSAANNPTSTSSGGLSPLNAINPSDIESIEILKDADATAIYGSRGANGVILITTKKGKAGETRVSVNLYSGFSNIGRTMDMLNTQQYVQIRKEAFANDGIAMTTANAPDIMLWDTTRYTDLKKLLISNTAHTNNLQASVSGGNEATQFLISGSYHKETTVYHGDFSDDIASLHFNISHTSKNKKFVIALSGMYSGDYNKLPSGDLTRYINLPPNLQLYDSFGKYSWADRGVVYSSVANSGLTNPLALLEQTATSFNENLSGSLQLSYRLFRGFIIKSNLGYNKFSNNETGLRPSTAIDPNLGVFPSSSFANSSNRSWIIEPQIEYNLESQKGKLSILIGSTLQNKSYLSSRMYGTNYVSDLLLNSITAAGSIAASNDLTQYHYNAVFGRVNYNYKDKYILNLTARRDGSSRFAPENQWANFGAFGAAWLFSNESFLQRPTSFLSFGKLRASYGITGNDQIGDYKYLNLWSNTSTTYNGQAGLFPRSLYNPDYSWEINRKFEVAVDLGFFKDRILLSTSYYINRCDNQLINYKLPSQTGFFQVVKNFPGLVQNTGLELVITTKNIYSSNFKWTSSFNITIPENKLVSFPDLSSSSYASTYIEGRSLSVIRALKYLGVDPNTGIYTYEDVNKDGLPTTADYQVFGNTDPDFYGGLQNNISFRNFDLSFFFQFTKQVGSNYVSQLYSAPPGFIFNQPTIMLNRWQKPGDITEIQKFTSTPNTTYGAYGNLSLSNGRYTDASFVKLKNISLAYHLPQKWLNRFKIGGCRLYLEGQNLLTLTKYKGTDPEVQSFYILPPLKTFVAGAQLNF